MEEFWTLEESNQSDGLVYFDKEWDPIIVGIGIAVLVIGVPLNLIVLVVSWHNRQRYPKQNVFACTLVCADLLMFCIGMGNVYSGRDYSGNYSPFDAYPA